MRVCSHENLAGEDEPLLSQEHVRNARSANIEKVRELLGKGKVTSDFALLSGSNVLRWDVVVKDDAHPVRIKHALNSNFLELLDRQRRRDVVGKHEITLTINQIARPHVSAACMRREDFLANCHPHAGCSFPIPP
jgi:hypothetical protein